MKPSLSWRKPSVNFRLTISRVSHHDVNNISRCLPALSHDWHNRLIYCESASDTIMWFKIINIICHFAVVGPTVYSIHTVCWSACLYSLKWLQAKPTWCWLNYHVVLKLIDSHTVVCDSIRSFLSRRLTFRPKYWQRASSQLSGEIGWELVNTSTRF